MRNVKRFLTGLLVTLILLGGVWGGLLTSLRCRSGLGQPLPDLLRLAVAEDGLTLEVGEKQYRLAEEQLRTLLGYAGYVEQWIPRAWRLGLLGGLALEEWTEPGPSGGKVLV